MDTGKALQASQFGRDDVEVIKDEKGFKGFFELVVKHLRHRKFEGGWSQPINRELFIKAEAAGAVLYDPVNDLVGLVEQFRVGCLESEYGPWCLEVVAGMIETGEQPEDLILREIKEEADLVPTALHRITAYYSTPGSCDEKIHLYCAECDLSEAGGVHGLADENEDIMLHVLPADEVLDAMLESRMNNAATLISLQWLAMHRSQLKNSA